MDDGGAVICPVSDTATLNAYRRYAFILDGLQQSSYANFRNERGVKIDLDAKPSKATPDVVNCARVDLRQLTQLVSHLLENRVVVKFYG